MRRHEQLLPRPLRIVTIAILLAVVLLPLSYILFASANSDLAVAEGAYLPVTVDFTAYRKIWSTVELGTSLVNSIVVAGIVAVASCLVAIGSAYVLVRHTFRGRLTVLRGLLALQSIPGTLLLLPVFVIFASTASALGVQVIGTRWSLVITYLTFTLPFSTWVLVTYLRGLPRELDEAARIEGAGPLQVLLRVYVPLAKPVYIAYGLVSVSYHWNNFLWPLIVTNSVEARPLTVGLQVFSSTDQGIDWSVICAATLMTSAPLLAAFLLFQRQFVQSFVRAGIR